MTYFKSSSYSRKQTSPIGFFIKSLGNALAGVFLLIGFINLSDGFSDNFARSSKFFVIAVIISAVSFIVAFDPLYLFTKKDLLCSLTIDKTSIHGITNGVLFDLSYDDVTGAYVVNEKFFRTRLIISTAEHVYEFVNLKNPDNAVKIIKRKKFNPKKK